MSVCVLTEAVSRKQQARDDEHKDVNNNHDSCVCVSNLYLSSVPKQTKIYVYNMCLQDETSVCNQSAVQREYTADICQNQFTHIHIPLTAVGAK